MAKVVPTDTSESEEAIVILEERLRAFEAERQKSDQDMQMMSDEHEVTLQGMGASIKVRK